MSAEDEDQNVGTAGDGQGDGSSVENCDDENARESEMDDPGGDQAVMRCAGDCFGGEDHGG
jgi:hypothetical protein